MIKKRASHVTVAVLAAGVLSLASFQWVAAETIKSDNYEVSEPQFSAGAETEVCSESGEYCAQASIGDLSGGEQSSGSYSARFEPIAEDSEPLLEVIVEPGAANLGVLATDRTATKTTVVKVRNYKSDGYTLHMSGPVPVYKDHFLATPTTPTASQMGTEQFGINVVKNTTPVVGENPLQVPSGGISFGVAEPGYDTPNLFQYEDGGVLARSERETGQTEYTISMIVNISGNTPAGHFTSDFSVIVVPVF
jgi:hypothetical protein